MLLRLMLLALFARVYKRGRRCLMVVGNAATLVVLGQTDGSTSSVSRSAAWWRLLLHIPIGVFNALLFAWSIAVGVVFFLAFMVYELWEGYCLRDQGYLDVRGWLWGFSLAALAGLCFFT